MPKEQLIAASPCLYGRLKEKPLVADVKTGHKESITLPGAMVKAGPPSTSLPHRNRGTSAVRKWFSSFKCARHEQKEMTVRLASGNDDDGKDNNNK